MRWNRGCDRVQKGKVRGTGGECEGVRGVRGREGKRKSASKGLKEVRKEGECEGGRGD